MSTLNFRILDVTWADWEIFAARPGVTTYYVAGTAKYTVIAIDNRFVYKSVIIDSGEVTDFETNHESGATEVASLDDAIGLANKLESINSFLFDSAGTAITLSGGNLKTSIFDASGNAAVITDGAALPGSRSLVLTGGSDGSNIRLFKTDASGNQLVSLTGTNTVRIQDSTGDTLDSTSGSLHVSLRDSAGTDITLSGGNLKTSLFDLSGNVAVGTNGSAFPGTAAVVIVGGTDGTNTRAIGLDTSGRVASRTFDGSGTSISSSSNALHVAMRDSAGNAITSTAGGAAARVLDVIVRDLFGVVADQVFDFESIQTNNTNVDQVILTYTVPTGKDFLLTGLYVGKTAANAVDAVPFRLRVNGTSLMVHSTDGGGTRYWNPTTSGFPQKIATAADVITITVTPSAGTPTTWNSTLFGYLRSI